MALETFLAENDPALRKFFLPSDAPAEMPGPGSPLARAFREGGQAVWSLMTIQGRNVAALPLVDEDFVVNGRVDDRLDPALRKFRAAQQKNFKQVGSDVTPLDAEILQGLAGGRPSIADVVAPTGVIGVYTDTDGALVRQVPHTAADATLNRFYFIHENATVFGALFPDSEPDTWPPAKRELVAKAADSLIQLFGLGRHIPFDFETRTLAPLSDAGRPEELVARALVDIGAAQLSPPTSSSNALPGVAIPEANYVTGLGG